jgi:peroxiredoxin
MPKPRTPVPELDVPLVRGGRWSLADQRPERFSLVVFYRGFHCPLCKDYVSKLDDLVGDLAEVGATSVLAVSGDEEWRAQRAVEEWQLRQVDVGYGLPIEAMQEWGLFRSHAIKEGQPNEFGEPGLFIVRPDGTLYASVIGSFPFLRPSLDEVVDTIRWVNEHDYPARGER